MYSGRSGLSLLLTSTIVLMSFFHTYGTVNHPHPYIEITTVTSDILNVPMSLYFVSFFGVD